MKLDLRWCLNHIYLHLWSPESQYHYSKCCQSSQALLLSVLLRLTGSSPCESIMLTFSFNQWVWITKGRSNPRILCFTRTCKNILKWLFVWWWTLYTTNAGVPFINRDIKWKKKPLIWLHVVFPNALGLFCSLNLMRSFYVGAVSDIYFWNWDFKISNLNDPRRQHEFPLFWHIFHLLFFRCQYTLSRKQERYNLLCV